GLCRAGWPTSVSSLGGGGCRVRFRQPLRPPLGAALLRPGAALLRPGAASSAWSAPASKSSARSLPVGAPAPISSALAMPFRTLATVGEWQDSLPPLAELSEDERELKMNLDQLYSDGKREGRAEGKAEGVLAVLEVRGVPVSAAQRKQVLA